MRRVEAITTEIFGEDGITPLRLTATAADQEGEGPKSRTPKLGAACWRPGITWN